jgi:Sulfotransferase family
MWPIFVFGTGRCGSTHIQRLITLSTCCWVWGEHEGFLAPLLESVRRCETGSALDRNVFRAGWRSDGQLISDMTMGSDQLAWLNRFDKEEFRVEVASLVDRMFRFPVPEGWTQWGFKEIRYGLDNNAPVALLTLFPTATAIFTFREPKATIESMIRAWGKPGLLNGPEPSGSFLATYKNCSVIWKKIMKYFLNHRQAADGKILFVSGDKLSRSVEEILRTFGLPLGRKIPQLVGTTNSGPKNWPSWARVKFDELFTADEPECRDLFIRACAASDTDFGGQAAFGDPTGDCGNGKRDELAILSAMG